MVYLQSLADGFEDPTMLMGSDADKELTRAIKSKGHQWVNQVCTLLSSTLSFFLPHGWFEADINILTSIICRFLGQEAIHCSCQSYGVVGLLG